MTSWQLSHGNSTVTATLNLHRKRSHIHIYFSIPQPPILAPSTQNIRFPLVTWEKYKYVNIRAFKNIIQLGWSERFAPYQILRTASLWATGIYNKFMTVQELHKWWKGWKTLHSLVTGTVHYVKAIMMFFWEN